MDRRVAHTEVLPHDPRRPRRDVRTLHRPHRRGARRGNHWLQLRSDEHCHAQRHGAHDPAHLRARADDHIALGRRHQAPHARTQRQHRRGRQPYSREHSGTRILSCHRTRTYGTGPHDPPQRTGQQHLHRQHPQRQHRHSPLRRPRRPPDGPQRRRYGRHTGDTHRTLRPQHCHRTHQHHQRTRHHIGHHGASPQSLDHRHLLRRKNGATAQKHQPADTHKPLLQPRQHPAATRRLGAPESRI